MTIEPSPEFIACFESEVREQYLAMGSKLRNTVRMKDNIIGTSTTFMPARRTPVSLYAVPSPIECILFNHYSGDWVYKFDDLKEDAFSRHIIASRAADAIGRKSNELIFTAMMGATETVKGCNIRDTVEVAHTLLGEYGTPDDGQRFAVVEWKQWSALFNLPEFAAADYLIGDELPWKGTQAKRWLNTIWLPHSGLPKTGNVRSCFWYHKTAVGHAIGSEVKTEITWHGNRCAHFVNNHMAQGACLIDPSRVVRMQCVESGRQYS